MRISTAKKRIIRGNKIIASDNGEIAIEVKRRNGEAVHYRIDKEDVVKVCQRRWFSHNGYCCSMKDYTFWYLAWELLGRPKKGYVLYYLNGDRKDNRKSNIQRLTWSQRNLVQKRKPNQSTGIRGVSLYKNGLYTVTIGPGGKRKSLRDREDAIAARKFFEQHVESLILRSTRSKMHPGHD